MCKKEYEKVIRESIVFKLSIPTYIQYIKKQSYYNNRVRKHILKLYNIKDIKM